MRITNSVITSRALSDLQQRTAGLERARQEVSAGTRILKPSDDALGTADAIRRRAEASQTESRQAAAADATDWLTTTDTALQQIVDVHHRVKALVVQAAQTTTGTNGRQAIAKEIEQLRASVVDSLKAESAGRPVFADTPATFVRDLGPGAAVQVNVRQADVGQPFLDTIDDVLAQLAANDVHALGTTALQDLGSDLDTLVGALASTGAAQSRVDQAEVRLADLADLQGKALNDLEGIDLAESLLRVSNEQSAYEAALRATSSVVQQSLMDFLR